MVHLRSGLLLLGGIQAALGALVGAREAGPEPAVVMEGRAPSPASEAARGVVTPQPALPNMVAHCVRFHLVEPGDTCWQIGNRYGVSASDIIRWNPSAGADCRTLWAGYYACVGVAHKKDDKGDLEARMPSKTSPATASPPTSTSVETPQPALPNMVDNCDRFHLVRAGDNCQKLATKYGVSVSDIILWNPSAGADCTTLWAGYWACVGVAD